MLLTYIKKITSCDLHLKHLPSIDTYSNQYTYNSNFLYKAQSLINI